MSKHISFPASHLSAYEIGKRVRVITKEGAKIEDTLTSITTHLCLDGKVALFLRFANAQSPNGDIYNDRTRYGFEVALDQMVKRIDDEG